MFLNLQAKLVIATLWMFKSWQKWSAISSYFGYHWCYLLYIKSQLNCFSFKIIKLEEQLFLATFLFTVIFEANYFIEFCPNFDDSVQSFCKKFEHYFSAEVSLGNKKVTQGKNMQNTTSRSLDGLGVAFLKKVQVCLRRYLKYLLRHT